MLSFTVDIVERERSIIFGSRNIMFGWRNHHMLSLNFVYSQDILYSFEPQNLAIKKKDAKRISQQNTFLQNSLYKWFCQEINLPRRNWERPFWRTVFLHFHLTYPSSAIEECLVNNQLYHSNRTLFGRIPFKRLT